MSIVSFPIAHGGEMSIETETRRGRAYVYLEMKYPQEEGSVSMLGLKDIKTLHMMLGEWLKKYDDADTPAGQQESERLTVEDLKNAWDKGYWHGINGHTGPGNPYRDQNVVPPTPAPVTAETIRESEVPSTWDDRDGDTWEWDGQHLRFHARDGSLSEIFEHDTPEVALSCHGPLTRSTAAPRGDYGKQEESDQDAMQKIFTTLLRAQKVEAERAKKIQNAFHKAFGEVYMPDSDPATAQERTDQ